MIANSASFLSKHACRPLVLACARVGTTTREHIKGRHYLSRRTTAVDLLQRDPSMFNLRETVAAGGSAPLPHANRQLDTYEYMENKR